MYSHTFTVFTSTYNRAHTLNGTFESLKAQTFTDFEWLVVDDGSTDETRELVRKWQKEARFPIRYIFQENRGMHWAVNRGVRDARGKFFIKLDSDDLCEPNALERFKYHWDKIPLENRHEYSGVSCLTQNADGDIVGAPFPFDSMDSNILEIRFRYRVAGEKWGFRRTDVMKSFPYPEFQGEKFFPESDVWIRIAPKFKTRYVNEVLRTYHFSFSPDRLSHPVYRARSPIGMAHFYREVVNLDYPIPFTMLIRNYANYIRYSYHGGIGILDQVRAIPSRLHWGLAFPIGYALYLRDRRLL